MKKKMPDNVVYNQEEERHEASLKLYGTIMSAPAIEVPQIMHWKGK